MEKNTDKRIIKTRRAIKSVFIELMSEIGFAKINVQRIVERAEINRSTFYAHYADKYDLLDEIENELLVGMKETESKIPAGVIAPQEFNIEFFMSNSQKTVNYLYENGRLFTLLLGDKGDPKFIIKFGDVIKSIWVERRLVDRLLIPQSYALAAAVGMMTGLITEWVKNDFRESQEEFIQIVAKIIKGLPKNMFTLA